MKRSFLSTYNSITILVLRRLQERLIDKALIKVCYSEQFEGLWKNRKFVEKV